MAWAPDYCTVAELREYATRSGVTVDDAQLGFAVTTASRAVDGTCNRQFGVVAAPEVRYYTARWSLRRGRWVVPVDDFQTTSGLLVNIDIDGDGTFSDAVTGFTKWPLNASLKGRPWERLVIPDTYRGSFHGTEGEVAVTALWGWTAVPVVAKQATLLQGSRLASRRDAPFGVAGSPEAGTELRLLARVDPDVEVALVRGRYVRDRWRVR